MRDDQSAHDAAMLLVAFITNHDEARMVGSSGMDRPFSPDWADAERRPDSIGPAATPR
jgi:hypothetical protein